MIKRIYIAHLIFIMFCNYKQGFGQDTNQIQKTSNCGLKIAPLINTIPKFKKINYLKNLGINISCFYTSRMNKRFFISYNFVYSIRKLSFTSYFYDYDKPFGDSKPIYEHRFINSSFDLPVLFQYKKQITEKINIYGIAGPNPSFFISSKETIYLENNKIGYGYGFRIKGDDFNRFSISLITGGGFEYKYNDKINLGFDLSYNSFIDNYLRFLPFYHGSWNRIIAHDYFIRTIDMDVYETQLFMNITFNFKFIKNEDNN